MSMAAALAGPMRRSATAQLRCTCAHLRPARTLAPRRRFASSSSSPSSSNDAASTSRDVAPSSSSSSSSSSSLDTPASRVPASRGLYKLLQAGERPVPVPLDPKTVDPGLMEPVPDAVPDEYGRVLHRPIPPELPYPKQQTRRRYIVFLGLTLASWGVFLHYSSNRLRYNTSVVQTLIWNVKTSPKVRDALGTDVHIVSSLLGPKIGGTVNMMQGVVDVSFPISGILGNGVVFFTSVRRAAQAPFQIIRWKVLKDDGEAIDLMSEIPE